MGLLDLYTKLPEWVKASPAVVLMLAALFTGYRGDWVWGSTFKASMDQCAEDKADLRAQRDEYKRIAFNSVGFINERAQQSAKINEEAVKPKPQAKPTVATVRIPITPITAKEKQEIQKPTDAEPATLERSLNASTKVLEKSDIKNASVEATKKP
jgi:hypothetical protein